MYSAEIVYMADTSSPDGPYTLTSTTDNFTHALSDGKISVYSTDNSLVGYSHYVYITASLSSDSSVTTASPVIFPVKFERCAITIDAWDLQDTINIPPQVDYLSPTVYPFNAPTFTYDDPSKDCAYEWTSTSVIQDPS